MCCNKNCDCVSAVILGAIAGVIIGLLFFFAVIATLATAVWISFGIAAVSLIVLTAVAAFGKPNVSKCICKFGSCLLIGSIGTILTVLIGSVVTLATGSVIAAIWIGIGAFFSAITVFSFVSFILCLIDSNCRCKDIL